MLPIAGAPTPDSPEALAEGLKRGLAARGLTAREVTAAGPWPALDLLRLDLTGLRISRSQFPALAGDVRAGGFTSARFELAAAPAELESAAVQVSLWADEPYSILPFSKTAKQRS